MNPLDIIRSAARRYAVVPCRDTGRSLVYAMHRVGSPEFLKIAMSALNTVAADAEQADELQSRLRGAHTDEDRAALTLAVTEAAAARHRQSLGDPEQVSELLGHYDRLVMASVFGFGVAVEGAVPGLVPIGVPLGDICVPLDGLDDEPLYIRPVRWDERGDPQADRFEIGELHEEERMALAGLVVEAFGPRKEEITSFPGEPRDAGTGVPVRKSVRKKTKRTDPVR